MQIILPQPSGGYTQPLLANLFRSIAQALGRAMPTDEAVPSFILKAPDGGRWKVTIGNAGALTTTKL